MVVLACAVIAFAGGGKKYKEHTIHGMKYDRRVIEKLLDDSEVPAEVKADERGVKKLKGKFKLDKSKPIEEAALDFIDNHRNAFMLKDPKKELKLQNTFKQPIGSMDIRYSQLYNGIEIWGKSIRAHISKDKDLDLIEANLVPTPDIDTTPLVTAEEAVEIAKADLKIPSGARIFPPDKKLVIYYSTLAYELGIESWRYFINAKDGSIVSKENILIVD